MLKALQYMVAFRKNTGSPHLTILMTVIETGKTKASCHMTMPTYADN